MIGCFQNLPHSWLLLVSWRITQCSALPWMLKSWDGKEDLKWVTLSGGGLFTGFTQLRILPTDDSNFLISWNTPYQGICYSLIFVDVHCSWVRIVWLGYRRGNCRMGVWFLLEVQFFSFFTTTSGFALGLSQPPVWWVLWVKWPQHDADSTPLPSAKG